MKNLIAFLIVVFVAGGLYSQNKITISLVGSVTNFSTSEKLFGATLYMMQNGKTIGKSISDEIGQYTVSGNITTSVPMELMISKPGYAAKKVLFELDKLKLKNANNINLQLLEELTIQLYENQPGADLSFTKTSYAEKFYWDENANSGNGACLPREKFKKDVDDKVNEAYSKAQNNGLSKNYVSRGDIANKNREFEKAIAYYDTALLKTPNDSIIITKKNIVQNTIKKIKEEEESKKKYEDLKSAGDEAFQKNNLTEAEQKYNLLLKDFPGDAYATSQLSKITNEKNQQALLKKNQEEATKLITQANTSKNAKKYDDAIAKLQQALNLDPAQKASIEKEISTIKNIQSDVITEEQIKNEIKSAEKLFKEKKYDDAINSYKNIDNYISKLTNQSLINSYSDLSSKGLKAVVDKKNQDGQEFKDQLNKAQDFFNKGAYSDADKILKSDPMKSRMNEPEVKDLSEKITKMQNFVSQKKDAYTQIKNKKNNEAFTQLKSLRDNALKMGALISSSEINQLKNSIDSLDAILNPKNISNSNVSTNNNSNSNVGIQLKAPGELVTDNPVDVFNELSENYENQKNEGQENLAEYKNELDKEADFQKKLNASRQEDENANLEQRKTEIELKALEQNKIPVQLQENLEESKRQHDISIYNKNIDNANQNEARDKQLQELKNEADSLTEFKLKETELKIENDIARIQETKNVIEKQSIESQKQNDSRAESMLDKKLDGEYAVFKTDSINAIQNESRINSVQNSKDFVIETKFSPNHLKDENGVEFKQGMTEKIYKIKNKDGFVTTIITRRVVVDKNGYGIVYEQNTNERGVNSFYKNGSPITEFVWMNESTGINLTNK